MKAMDESAKIKVVTNKNKFVKEHIHIVFIGLGSEMADYLWSRYGYEFTTVKLLRHSIKVCIPLTNIRNLPKQPPFEHPCLPEFPVLGTLSSDVATYYTEHAKNYNKYRLEALQEYEKEVLVCTWDGTEYIHKVNWIEKKLKKGYNIECETSGR